MEYFRSNRRRPRSFAVSAILRATVSGRPDVERTLRPDLQLELHAVGRAPAALGADAVVHEPRSAARPARWPPRRCRRRARGVHRDRQLGAAELVERPAVEVDERREALGRTTDDRDHERQAVAGGAHDGLRAATDADPGLQPVAGRGVDALLDERLADGAGPGDRLLGQQRGEQVELLVEQLPRTGRGRSRTAGTTR